MFEKETEQLMTAVRQATIGDRKSIGLREVFESSIPGNVKVFFRSEVESLLDAEQKGAPPSSRFAHDLPEVLMLREQIATLLVHNFIFTKEDFDATLDKCVHFMLNYLCRPQWTLNSFLFEETGRAPASLILRKLRYFRDYGYFPDIMRKYLGQRNITELTLEEGRNLIARIDAEITREHSSLELAQMTMPLYEFVGYARSHELSATPRTVPTRALIYFFDDKKMAPLCERLTRERDVVGNKEIGFHRLINLIEQVRTGDDHARLVNEDSEPLPAADETSAGLPGLEGREGSGAMEEEKRHEVPKPLPPAFSLEEERSIIKHLFRHDEAAFRAAMEEVLEAGTWDEAAHAIDHYFVMNDVEPFTKEAILFTNRLQSRFTEKNVRL
ncbi:MAG TPA: hypothetical protein VMG34_08860 [Bacteroidota bacterium]|nr:hypothetical protein [Bacteroidota bacterium]